MHRQILLATVILALTALPASAATAFPSDLEQLMLELINRARMDPAAEAARYGIALNEGLAPGTLTATPKQPLAFDRNLISAAQLYAQYLLDHDAFSHTADRDPFTRMLDEGYTATPRGENLAVKSYPASPDFAAEVAALHQNLFVDGTTAGRGHRLNILDGTFDEAGVGVRTKTGYHPPVLPMAFDAILTTEDFGQRAGAELTGVVYEDLDLDSFYTPGEGVGGVTIAATRTSDMMMFSTSSWSSGGYTLPLPAGTYDVRVSGGTLVGIIAVAGVVVGTDNIKLDFDPSQAMPPPCANPACADCDQNGIRNIIDALLAAQNAAGLITLVGQGFTNCNVTGNQPPAGGLTVDILDALSIAQFSAGLPVTLACC